MSYLHDEVDDDRPDHVVYRSQPRELTLSTGTILGIFFGLTLLCALFFGFGYNMGSKSRQAPIVTADTSSSPSTAADFNHFKPAPGAPASQPAPAYSLPKPATTAPTADAPAVIIRTPAPTATTPASTKPPDAPTPIPHSIPSTETGLTFVVQVAAVSHQDDADRMVAALMRKNYSVAWRNEPQDKLFHIQIGPFATKKDAEAMRQRLQTDGYNAIVK